MERLSFDFDPAHRWDEGRALAFEKEECVPPGTIQIRMWISEHLETSADEQ